MTFRTRRILKILLIPLLLLVFITAYLVRSARQFTVHNLAAEGQFTELVNSHKDKVRLHAAFVTKGYHVFPWKNKASNDYYAVYRRSLTAFDPLADQYYKVTGRGSRRLVGLVFFDDHDQATSYTLASNPQPVFHLK